MTDNSLIQKLESVEKRISILEEMFEKKRRDDNDLLANLDQGNFSESFLKKINSGGTTT